MEKKSPKIIRNSMRQRVRIAKDVIEQVRIRRLIPTRGVYFYSGEIGNGIAGPLGADARQMLSEAKRCAVCARGALLVAMIDRYDQLKLKRFESIVDKANGDARDREYMDQLFPERDIENAFEGWDGADGSRWKVKYPNDADRMIAIMLNVIKNKGRFEIAEVTV